MTEEWNYWAQPVAWRELSRLARWFTPLPSGGLEMLIEAMVTTRLPEPDRDVLARRHPRRLVMDQQRAARSDAVVSASSILTACAEQRSTTDATCTVGTGPASSSPSNDGAARRFDLLRRLPSARPRDPLVLRDFPVAARSASRTSGAFAASSKGCERPHRDARPLEKSARRAAGGESEA